MASKKDQRNEAYKQAFKAADSNGDGELSIQEFTKLLRKNDCHLSDQQIAETFLFFSDTDKDKTKITFTEFCQGLKRLEEFQTELQKFFNQLDADKSGFLDRNELKALLDMAGMKPTDAELTEILQRADKNGDNKISFDEFVAAVC